MFGAEHTVLDVEDFPIKLLRFRKPRLTDDSALLFIDVLPVLVGDATAQGFYADFEAGQG